MLARINRAPLNVVMSTLTHGSIRSIGISRSITFGWVSVVIVSRLSLDSQRPQSGRADDLAERRGDL
jgi:hypothetical protein